VVQHLDLADVYNLSFSCKRFQYLLHEANITKLLLEVSSHARTKLSSIDANSAYPLVQGALQH
jgi:hypothetical protein